MWHRGNISSRFSSHLEADASDLLENHEEIVPHLYEYFYDNYTSKMVKRMLLMIVLINTVIRFIN